MYYGQKFLCLVLGHMLLASPQVMAQQDSGKPSVSKTDYDAALDKAVKASQAASDAQKVATDAAKKADSAQAEVDKLKQDQQRDQEKADTDGQVKRLESEIKETEKKLENIDKTEQKVVNNVTNPQGQTPLTPDEDKLRQEALGGSSVPSVPQEVRDSFEATKQKLIDELKQKKQDLEDAKKKAAEQAANPATTADLEKQIADREAEIKAKEAELEEARKKEQQARQAEKDASAAADQAARDFQEQKKRFDQQRAIDEARRKLKEAEEQLERAKAALERKQAELNRNSELARIFAEIFRLLNQLSELLEELTGENADPTGALEQGAKILDEINRLLNDPNSNFQRLKDLLTDNEFKLLKDAINRLRNAQRNLQNLQKEQADAAKASATSVSPQNLRDIKSSSSSHLGRATLLKSPSSELHNPIAIQKYAALERAVSSGDLEAIRQLSIVDSIDNDEGSSSPWNPVTAPPGADTGRDASEVVMVAAIEDYLKIGDVKSKNGASSDEPAAARIQVYLPDDIRAGDTISGVAGTEDSGSSPAIPVQSLPQRLAVIRSLDVAAGSNPSVQEIEQMQQQTEQTLQSILQQVVPGGSTVELRSTSTAVDQPGMQDFPGRQSAGSSRLVTMDFSYRATDATGQQISIDHDQLQSALDQHPTLGGTAGVALPRDAQATPNDPHFSATGSWGETYADQWALKRVGFGPTEGGQPSAWPTEPNLLVPCVVAVIGSGVDWTHPELQGQMWMNPGEDPWNGQDDDGNGYIDDQFGWNFRENNSDVMDTGGHDTHVAGVIAARTHNDYGIAGANPAARIMALKAANYLGQADAVSISQAIRYAVNNGARVINISYGGDRSSPLEKRAIEYAASHGVLVVAAMGNQGVDAKDHAIASSPLVLTVAGSTMQDQRAGFSNWGQPVDLTAPAMDILSLRARGTDFLLYTGENPNYRSGAAIVGKQHDLYRASGTSFASPLVSGAASLLFSRRSELTADQVRRMLLMSAEDIDIAGFDQNTGAGVLSVARAVAADPAHVLLPQIVAVAVARRDGKTVVELSGRMEASGEYDRWLQIAFGESPGKNSWKTISHSRNTGFEDGVLGTIPAAEFSRAGVWSIRMLVQDGTKSIRQARATLTTQ